MEGATDDGRETLADRREAAADEEGGESEERGLTLTAVDGGSTRRAVVTADVDATGRLVRATDNRAAEAGSLFLRSLVKVVLASESTEEGRETLGVPKIDDSRRALDLVVVVELAPVFDTPPWRLICLKVSSISGNHIFLWMLTISSSCCLASTAIFI